MKLYTLILVGLFVVAAPVHAAEKKGRHKKTCLQLCVASLLFFMGNEVANAEPLNEPESTCYSVTAWELNGRKFETSQLLCTPEDPEDVRRRVQHFFPVLIKDVEVEPVPCKKTPCLDSVAAIQPSHLTRSNK